jgi:hypothetical protein
MARILITNHTRAKDTGIYVLDTKTAGLTRLYDRPANGVTRSPQGIFFVEPEGDVYHVDPDRGEVKKRAETGFRWCHDLRWIRDSFYLVSSKTNRIVRLDPDFKPVDSMQVVEQDDDVCHANCIVEVNGEMLLTIFTLSPGTRKQKNRSEPWRREGKILRLDWERKKFDILFEPLAQPHSLVWRDGQLFCCESHTSELAVVSLEKKTKRTLRRMYGFVRGIAFAEGSVYVGLSERRHRGPFLEGLLSRFRMTCGVMELDAKTWAHKRSIPVPGRQVYELMNLDEAH